MRIKSKNATLSTCIAHPLWVRFLRGAGRAYPRLCRDDMQNTVLVIYNAFHWRYAMLCIDEIHSLAVIKGKEKRGRKKEKIKLLKLRKNS